MLGVVRGRQQRYGEAEALFRRVLQLNPTSIVASRNLAGALLAQEKADDAIRQYNQAIQLNPQDSDLKIEVAKLNLERGNFAGALSTLETIKPDRFPLGSSSRLPVLAWAEGPTQRGLIPQLKGLGAALDLAQVFVTANDSDAALKTLSLVTPAPARPPRSTT